MRESFLKYLRYEKRVSPHTLTAYQNDLSQFEKFLSDTFPEESLERAEHNVIRSWIVDLVDKGMDAATINRKIACLRTFYKFLRVHGSLKNRSEEHTSELQSREKLVCRL